MSSEPLALVAGAATTGLAVAAAAYPFAAAYTAPRRDELLSPPEARRRERLRGRSALYTAFEPLAEDVAAGAAESLPLLVGRLQGDLDLLEPAGQWRAEDFFAIKRLESGVVFLGAVALGYALADGLFYGAVIGLGLAAAYPYFQASAVVKRAATYRGKLDSRLPLIADLMALMLEGGSDLGRAMDQASDENRGHPLGDELARARNAVRAGDTQSAALQAMGSRVGSADLSELVFMVNTADARGTEIKVALRDMAERLRIRRVQRLERKAQEAQVKISGPALVIMLACLAVIMAPLLLSSTVPGG